jgi:hypothetical protein
LLTLLIDDIREFNADYTARNSEAAKEMKSSPRMLIKEIK